MATRISKVIQQLRGTALLQDACELTDGQLLECFVNRREGAALEVLVRRHGPMVWGVCGRILPNHHDAEDAFQATFLVLVRRAGSIVPREMVGNWLYGVAHQTARKARATTAKRRLRERQVADLPEPIVTDRDRWSDLQAVLDQELSRLPDKYRVALVLCDLEGKTRKEAARQLGCPEGTVAARLTRGRVMLAKRLARHSVAFSGGALAGLLAQQMASACVPAAVLSGTLKAVTLVAAGQVAAGAVSAQAVALTAGVLKTMWMTKLLQVATATLLMLAVLGVGTVGLTSQFQTVGPGNAVEMAKGPADPLVEKINIQVPPFNNPEKVVGGDNRRFFARQPIPDPALIDPGQRAKKRVYQIGDDELPKMLRDPGDRFDVEVVGRINGTCSGTDLYFCDSDLEVAAVHAGLVKQGEKAIVTVTVVKCPESEPGSTRNGVKSSRWDGARATDTAFLLQKRAADGGKKRGGDGQKVKPPKKAEKEQKVLTPEEAIQQRPKEKVTVEFKVQNAAIHRNPAFVPAGEEIDYIEFKYNDRFYFHLYGKAVTHIKRLGIEPSVYFRDKIVRVTGQVFANGDPADKNTPYGMQVDGLDQFEVVK